MAYYAVNMNNGTVTVLNIIDETSNITKEIAKWGPEQKNGVVDYHIIDQSEIPTDRSFRNAWNFNKNARFGHDMNKAKEIFKDKIRSVRAPLLEALDVEYIKADEKENAAEKNNIVIKKQKLRDATANINIANATTIIELKSAWDTDLLGSNPYF